MCDPFGTLIELVYADVKALLIHRACTISDSEVREKYNNLKDKADKLKASRHDIEKCFPKGVRSNVCQYWITKAKEIENEAKEFEDKFEKEDKRSCKWVYRYPSYKLWEDMGKKANQIEEFLQEGGKLLEGSSSGQPLKPIGRRINRPLDSEWMPSVHKDTEEKLISFLRDEKVRRIGVWGITGCGKSMIMENLRKNEDVIILFESVIFVAISGEWGLKELQDDIMGQLKVNVEGSADMLEKARRISEMLQRKQCLILIDNFEEKIDLDKILGIQDNKKRCKVVFASRSRGVCFSMQADDVVHVDRLSPDDAWTMFKELVGEVIHRFPRIQEQARLVVRECDGLPLLIDMVARNLRNVTDLTYWGTQKKQLQGWESPLQGMGEALQTLEFCYDSLNDPSKKCFLYCALYPEECQIHVDHLLECWISEGFIHEKSFREARDMGNSILHDLISGSFLARLHNKKYVKMTKLLRKMALKISSENNNFELVVKPEDSIQNEEWHKARRISLMDSPLRELPVSPDCAELLTLFLQRNKNLVDIPKNFFRSMHSLRVLDLYGTGIASLPPSLSKLVSLKALYLNSCFNLVDIPSGVKRLELLEVLDIQKTKLNLHQIRSLIWLKCLRISFSSLIRVNHMKGRVSDFCSLEEFCVFIDSPQQWTNSVVDQVIQEVAMLEKLTSLEFCFPDLFYLQLFINKRRPWNNNSNFTFHFSVGFQDSSHSLLRDSVDYPIRNSLNLVDTEGADKVFATDKAFAEVLKETDIFGLIKQKKVPSLSSFGIDSMEKMLVCLIEECNDMEVIISNNGRREAVLKFLKDLYIKNLPKLRTIWEGHVLHGSLVQLTTLVISKCPKLKNVFSHGLIQLLHELKHLKVEECHQIEEIIARSESEGLGTNALQSLRNLELVDLPQLRSISDDSFKWPSLQKIKISFCDELKRLPFSSENAAKLRRIEGQQSWWEALEWEDQAYKQRLQSHFHPQPPPI